MVFAIHCWQAMSIYILTRYFLTEIVGQCHLTEMVCQKGWA